MTGARIECTIRRLAADDAEACRAFRLRALVDTPTAFTSNFAEESAKPLTATLERLATPGKPNNAVFGAFDAAGQLVGIAGLRVGSGEQERHRATLFGMAVAGHATGQGIGRALVVRVLEYARGVQGLLQVDLRVTEGNLAAERLYRSCGFAEWGLEQRAVIVAGEAITKRHMVCMLDEQPQRS